MLTLRSLLLCMEKNKSYKKIRVIKDKGGCGFAAPLSLSDMLSKEVLSDMRFGEYRPRHK